MAPSNQTASHGTWRKLGSTPFLMVLTLLLATITAVAHHIFYSRLDKQIVQSQWQQEWYGRVGTGLAFLVKALLTASVGLSYTQLLWYHFRRRPFTFTGIDALFGVVNNVWDFFCLEVWGRASILAVVALILWTLPFVAIVSPSTLTVQLAPQQNETVLEQPLPVINFTSNAFATTERLLNIDSPIFSPISKPRLNRLFNAVWSQGRVLTVPAPFANCSYSVQFFGPSISCGAPSWHDAEVETEISKVIRDFDCSTSSWGCPDQGNGMISYVGFVPLNLTHSENPVVDGLRYSLLNNSMAYPSDFTCSDRARLYTIAPNEIGYANETGTIECGLFNSSYTVDFDFINGSQNISLRNLTKINGITGSPGAGSNDASLYCSESVISTWTSPTAPTSSHIAMMAALGRLLIGWLPHMSSIAFGTQITSSVLMDTQEMVNTQYTTPDNLPASIANMSLSQALEEVFINATLSLFSDTSFLQDTSTASTGETRVFTPQNMYVYHAKNLLIAYISGIFMSVVLVATGFYCIKDASLKSFGSSFSTIVRTTRNSELDDIIPAAATSGAQPLPKSLAVTEMMLVRRPGGYTIGDDKGEDRICFSISRDDSKFEEAGEPGTSSEECHQPRNSTEVSLLETRPEHPRTRHFEGVVIRRETI